MMITQARKAALAKRFGVDCKLTDYSWVQAMDDDMAGTINLYYEDMEWILQATGQQVDNCNTITGRETGIFINCNVNADIYVNNTRVGAANSIVELDTVPKVLLLTAPGYVPRQYAIQLVEGSIYNTAIDLQEVTPGRETGLFVSCNVQADVMLNNISIGSTGQIITLSPGTKLLLFATQGYESKAWAVQITDGNITNLQMTLLPVEPGRDTGIFIDCNVQASIFLNNEIVGTTGSFITLAPGTKLLMLTRPGYTTKTYAAQVRTGTITNIQITLYEAAAGRDTGIFVDCNVEANIYVNNENIGKTGMFLAMQPGTIRLLVAKNGYSPRTWATQVTNGNITNMQVQLTDLPSTENTGLFVDCNIQAEISLSGVKIGNSGEFIPTTPGMKSIVISASGYEPRSWAAQVTGGYITNVQIELTPTSGERATGIFIDCNVDADVYEGETKIGVTGEVIPMTPGTKTIKLSKEGYVTATRSVQITTGSISNMTVLLQEDTTQATGLFVSCNVPARVWIDNVDVGPTGELIVTSPGAKSLLVKADGYEPRTWAAQVTEGNITNVSITLNEATGEAVTGFQINCNVSANVYEGENKLGITGTVIPTSPGVKSLVISAEGYTSKTWTTTVVEGQVTNSQVTLYVEPPTGGVEGENGVEYSVTILKDGLGNPIVSKPETIMLGTPQWYSIMVKNDMNTTWFGYLGVKLMDGLGNSYTHEPNRQYAQPVPATETKSIKSQVTIPVDTVLQGNVVITFLLRGFRTLSES